MLLHIPAVQHSIANKSAEIISEKLGTKVQIGSVSLGLLNRIIIDGVMIEDQTHHKLMTCHRLSTKINILSLLKGKIDISSAQIFGMKACLTKASADAPLNCQFILDSLASKDTTTHKPLDLHISSLIIRNTEVSYDRLDIPQKNKTFDPNHLSVSKVSSHIMLYALTDDSISVRLKKLSLAEKNAGLTINSLSFVANAGQKTATIQDFSLKTDNSDISIDASLEHKDKKITSARLKSNHSSISSSDLACFIPEFKKTSRTIFLDTDIEARNNILNVRNLAISSSGRSLYLSANAKVQTEGDYIFKSLSHPERLKWQAVIPTLHVDHQILSEIFAIAGVKSPLVSKLGNIDYSATANGNKGTLAANGNLQTAIGNFVHDIAYSNQHLKAHVQTSTMHLGTILSSDIIGDTEADITASADIKDGDIKTIRNARIKLKAPLLTLKKYPYRNVEADIEQNGNSATANLDIADLNANLSLSIVANNIQALLNGKPENLQGVDIKASVNHINPNALGLINNYESTSFSLSTKAHINQISKPLDNININIDNFAMRGVDKSYILDNLSLIASSKPGNMREIHLVTDFANAYANGCFDYNTLKYSLTNLIAQKLPTLPGLPQYHQANNNISFQASLDDTQMLREILGIDINSSNPITLDGHIDDSKHNADITLRSDNLQYSGTTIDDAYIHLFTFNDTLNLDARARRRDADNKHFTIGVQGKAINNQLKSLISWDNGKGDDFRGSIQANSQFFKNAMGIPTASINIQKSEAMIGDSLWHIHPSNITYSGNHLSVDNFLVEHGTQHVSINGEVTKSNKDSLVVNLRDVDVAYIMNLVNFHSVEFGGFASGTAVVKGLFTKPYAYADLNVNNFLFQYGRLGNLSVTANWDNDMGQINVDGRCSDKDVVPSETETERYVAAGASIFDDDDNMTRDGRIDVKGYISIKRNYIDLDINARNARLDFMHSFCDSFMDDIVAWGSGNVRIIGDLSKVNMTGDAVANGSVKITPLNTTYTLLNDSIHFIPNDMIIERGDFRDKNGNRGVISGALHHRYLGRMTFDLEVNAKHLLCFDFPSLNGETFCGHVIGTGKCKMTGRPGQVTFDIEAYPEEATEFTYNVSSPDALQNQEFIEWRDASQTADTNNGIEFVANALGSLTGSPISENDSTKNELDEPDEDFHTNLYMNFLIHATSESTLRLIMDERTGDIITFNGNGTLRANYYNKGGMQIFGNYNIEAGEYNMTIQQVINKRFSFLPGGSLSFGGDPFEAGINLQAQYVVPSVPLSDLNIGNSFSNNTVRVNCLMNITGTAGQPQVEFDLNLPQASTDIQQMITSLMDGEEERNQQVLYLLSVGRFYNVNNNATEAGQSKASIAMQSFLSGTLSQQLNNIISNNILKNQNWNFGTNISPGDEGMNNAEYEGLISGRMLNNRLLLNGQFGYRDNANATTSFIGDFDVRYLLFPNGNLQVRVYNQTSDRYFTKSNLNTQGIGIIFKHDFNSFIPYFLRKKPIKK